MVHIYEWIKDNCEDCEEDGYLEFLLDYPDIEDHVDGLIKYLEDNSLWDSNSDDIGKYITFVENGTVYIELSDGKVIYSILS